MQSRNTCLKDRELNAVRALQTAVVRTSIYIGKLEGGGEEDRTHEEQLASLWSDASNAFYAVNGRIARLLHLKALSWARPQQWIDEKVKKHGITLDEMNDLVLQIMKKGDVGA